MPYLCIAQMDDVMIGKLISNGLAADMYTELSFFGQFKPRVKLDVSCPRLMSNGMCIYIPRDCGFIVIVI